MTTRTTEESMSPPWLNFDRSHQLLPLLEATLVQDVPNEPVYEAFPMPAPEVNDAHGWLRISLKLRVVILGVFGGNGCHYCSSNDNCWQSKITIHTNRYDQHKQHDSAWT